MQQKKIFTHLAQNYSPSRFVFLESQPEVVSSQPLQANPDVKRISHERISKDIEEARAALYYISDEVQKSVINDLRAKLDEIEKKYEAINTDEPLKTLEKEVYSRLEPILLKAAERTLKNCKNMQNPRFEKQGFVFSFENEKMKASLDAHYNIEAVTMDGVTVHFLNSVKLKQFDQKYGKITIKTIRRIIERFRPQNLDVTMAGGRYEFSLAEKGEQRKFVATTEDVLEVKEEAPPTKIAQFLLLNKRYNILRRKLKHQLNKLAELFNDKKEILDNLIQVKDDFSNKIEKDDELYALKEINKKDFSQDQREAWEKFLSSIPGFVRLKNDWLLSRKNCSYQKLEGMDEHGNPVQVEEFADPSTPGNFSWSYLNEEGKETKGLIFYKEHCKQIRQNKNGTLIYLTILNDDGSISNEYNMIEGCEDYYSEKGQKIYRCNLDLKNPLKVDDVVFYDDEGTLLDKETLKIMPLAKLEKFILSRMKESSTMDEWHRLLLAKACFSAADYIKYCPRGKDILLKAARLSPYNAFAYFEVYKGNLYAMDVLLEAAAHMKEKTIMEFFKTEQSFKDLSDNETLRLLDAKTRKNPNFSTAEILLDDFPRVKDPVEEISYFLRDPALKDLSKIKLAWLDPYWDKLKLPLPLKTDAQILKWKTGIRIMIARNLFFQKKEITPTNVQKEFFKIIEQREQCKDVNVFKGRNVVVAAHNELLTEPKGTTKEDIDFYIKESGDIHRFGKKGLLEAIKKQQNGQGSLELIRPEKDRKSLEKAKEDILRKLETTRAPMTFFFDGHGDPESLFLSSSEIPINNQTQGAENDPDAVKITADEFAQALKVRFKNFPELAARDPHKKDVFIFASCLNFNFIQKVYALMGNIPKPIMLGESEYGQFGYSSPALKTGSEFSANVLGLEEANEKPTTLGDVFEEEFSAPYMNSSLFIGDEKNELMQIAKNEKTSTLSTKEAIV